MGTPIGGRKRDFPEIRRRRIEFDGDMIALGHLARRASYFAGDFFFRLAVLQYQARIDGEISLDDDDGSMMIHAEGSDFVGGLLPLHGDVDIGAHAKHNALAAPVIVGYKRRPRLR